MFPIDGICYGDSFPTAQVSTDGKVGLFITIVS